MQDNVVLVTFLQAWPWIVAIPCLAPEDRYGATSLHKGQSVAVHMDQLLCFHIVSHMSICIHPSAFVPHPFGQGQYINTIKIIYITHYTSVEENNKTSFVKGIKRCDVKTQHDPYILAESDIPLGRADSNLLLYLRDGGSV